MMKYSRKLSCMSSVAQPGFSDQWANFYDVKESQWAKWASFSSMGHKLVAEEYAENVEKTNIIKLDQWRKQNLLTNEQTLIVPKRTVGEMCRSFIDGSKKILIT